MTLRPGEGILSALDRRGILLLCAALIAVMRMHTWEEPLERDLTLYAVIAHEMLGGRELYADLWDHKPPAIFVTYAAGELVAGYGRNAIYLLNVGAAIATLLGIASVARRLGGDVAGIAAALLWTVLCGDPRLQANQPNTEVFMNALLVWGFRSVLDVHATRFAALGAGLLFAIASMFKHVAVFPAALLAVACVLTAERARVRPLLVIAATGAASWLALFAYFAMTGRRESFVAAVFLSNITYAGSLGDNVLNAFRNLFGPSPRVLAPLMLMTIAAFAVAPIARAHKLLLGAWCIGTFVAIAAPSRFFPHYFQLWLPPLIVGTVALASSRLVAGVVVRDRADTRPSATMPTASRQDAGATVLALLLVAFAYYEGAFYRHDAARWSRFKYGDLFSNATDAAKTMPRAERIYVWGDEPTFYFERRLPPPTGVMQREHLFLGSYAPVLGARVLADLQRTPPDVVIVNEQARSDHEVLRWIDAHYTRLPVDAPPPFAYYARSR